MLILASFSSPDLGPKVLGFALCLLHLSLHRFCKYEASAQSGWNLFQPPTSKEAKITKRKQKMRQDMAVHLLKWATCRVVHLKALLLIGLILQWLANPSIFVALQCFVLCVGYSVDLAICNEWLEIDWWHANFVSALRFSVLLLFMMMSDTEANPSNALLHVSGVLFGCLHPVDTWLRVLFCSGAMSIHLYSLPQVEKESTLSCAERASPYIIVLIVIFALNKMVHAVLEASEEKDQTSTLLSSFRHVVRGLADGDVLLDSEFKICGDSARLEQILSTRQKLGGRSFLEFVKDEEKEKFVQFIATSSGASSQANQGAQGVQCIRVHLETEVQSESEPEVHGGIGVDVFHVAIPDPWGDGKENFCCHLLAFKEDSESRIHAKNPGFHSQVPSYSSRLDSYGKYQDREETFTMSSSSSEVEPWEELKEVTLVLNGSSELFDAENIHFCFREIREPHDPHDPHDPHISDRPNLRKFAKPTDWVDLRSALNQYVSTVSKDAKCGEGALSYLPPQASLGTICFKLPGNARYTKAKSAKVGVQKILEDGSVRIWLKLTNFDSKSRKLQRLEGIQEL